MRVTGDDSVVLLSIETLPLDDQDASRIGDPSDIVADAAIPFGAEKIHIALSRENDPGAIVIFLLRDPDFYWNRQCSTKTERNWKLD